MIATGAHSAITPKHRAMAGTPDIARTTAKLVTPAPVQVTANVRMVTDSMPAWFRVSTARSRHPPGLCGMGGDGTHHDHQMQKRPIPKTRPTTTPTASPRPVSAPGPAVRQQRREIDPATTEPLFVRWVAIRAYELLALLGEDVRDLHDLVLRAPGHGHDLADPSRPVRIEPEVYDEVDTRRDGRNHEARAHVLAGQQRKCAHFRDGFAGGVGVHGAHARNPAVQRDQQVEAFVLPNLTDDEPVRPHPQRLFDEAPERHFPRSFQARLTALHGHGVPEARLQLEHLFTGDEPFPGRHRGDQAIEQRRLPGLSTTGDQDVEAYRYGGLKEVCCLPGERSQLDELGETTRSHDELADVHGHVSTRDVRDDDVQPRAVGQCGVHERA